MAVPVAVLAGVFKQAKGRAPADTTVLHELEEMVAAAFKQADPEFDSESFLESTQDGRKQPRQWVVSWTEPNGVKDERVVFAPTAGAAAAWLYDTRPYLMRHQATIKLKIEPHYAILR